MKPQPRHLGPTGGEQFSDPAVVRAYRHRPPYPEPAVRRLLELASGRSALLDIGCGRGDLTLPMAPHFARVDAVDPSSGMLEEAAARAGSRAAHVQWHCARFSAAPIEGPYDLITAAHSLHWTDWTTAFPRLVAVLAADARLAIVSRRFESAPWDPELSALIARYSTNRDHQPYVVVDELVSRGLFAHEGTSTTEPRELSNTRAAYIEAMHSANGFSRDRMTPAAATAFDTELDGLLTSHGVGETVPGRWHVEIVYGRPLAP